MLSPSAIVVYIIRDSTKLNEKEADTRQYDAEQNRLNKDCPIN